MITLLNWICLRLKCSLGISHRSMDCRIEMLIIEGILKVRNWHTVCAHLCRLFVGDENFTARFGIPAGEQSYEKVASDLKDNTEILA